LEEAGYLRRIRHRTPSGHVWTETLVYDRPCLDDDEPPAPPAEEQPPTAVAAERHEADDRPTPAQAPPESVPDAPALEGDVAIAFALLAHLRTREPRLVLSERDAVRLAPAAARWLERAVTPEQLTSTLTSQLPPTGVKHPARFLGHRLTQWLPPALPEPVPGVSKPGRPAPMQACDGCERGFRSPEPGLCRDCREAESARSSDAA
jgi:hypothetical protein